MTVDHGQRVKVPKVPQVTRGRSVPRHDRALRKRNLWRVFASVFPDEGNGDSWEFRPAPMGYIDVYQHHADGTVTQLESILADVRTLEGVRA